MNTWIEELRKTAILAFPMILSQVSQHMIQVIDSAMIGRVGVIPLAASAFASSVFTIPIVFCFGLCTTITILASSAFGENDLKKASHILRVGLVVSTGAAIVLAGIFGLGTGLLDVLGQTEEVIAEAKPYYLILLASMIPAIAFACCKNLSEAMNRPWAPLVIVIGMLGSNVFFNWVLIFGKFGFPELGLVGAGIGSFLSRFLAALAMILWISANRNFCFTLFSSDWFQIKSQEVEDFLHVGIPTGFQIIFEVSAFVFAAIMMGWISEITLAAHQISITVAAMTFMVVLGLSFATTIRVGQYYGRKDFVGLRRAGLVGWCTSVLFMGTCMIGLILLRHQIPTWFVDDVEVVQLASGLLIIAGLFQVVDGIQISMMAALRGVRDVKVPTVLVMFVYYGVCLPLAYVLAFKFGLEGKGIWTGLAVGLALSATALTIRFHVKSSHLVKLAG